MRKKTAISFALGELIEPPFDRHPDFIEGERNIITLTVAVRAGNNSNTLPGKSAPGYARGLI